MAFTKDLDDLEQKILRFLGSVESFIDAQECLVEQSDLPVEFVDRMSNLCIGFKEFVNLTGGHICDDLENHITNQHK